MWINDSGLPAGLTLFRAKIFHPGRFMPMLADRSSKHQVSPWNFNPRGCMDTSLRLITARGGRL
jgi:hypothetical protein